ncbi:hypothetical protein Tel_17075 (plasmid) [Candidatus Tenderia electrophaga]|jgi:hypothetical protein|uniref:Outer membrane protein beta-barrel domain-containing protein n=1 Tax=Candidatus Tenderia electrophaga TaxID=1748243 RepID=A0A0S2TIN2_9GAMM|nr:hypothetical protein Tel_17075 [Candidatus Tenderia electrophaga]
MKLVGCFAVLACVGVAQAGEFGYTAYGASLSVDDPDGTTSSTSYLAPFNGFYADSLKRDIRYQVEAFADSVILDAGINQIGQKVQYQGVGLSLQHRFRLTPDIKPWLGVGVDYIDLRYRDRHSVDTGGYLTYRFPDRSESGMNLVLNAANYWAFSRSWDIGLVAKLGQPVASDSTFLKIGISALYR